MSAEAPQFVVLRQQGGMVQPPWGAPHLLPLPEGDA